MLVDFLWLILQSFFFMGPSAFTCISHKGLIRSYLHRSCGFGVINLTWRTHDNFKGLVKPKNLSFWHMGFKVGETDCLTLDMACIPYECRDLDYYEFSILKYILLKRDFNTWHRFACGHITRQSGCMFGNSPQSRHHSLLFVLYLIVLQISCISNALCMIKSKKPVSYCTLSLNLFDGNEVNI